MCMYKVETNIYTIESLSGVGKRTTVTATCVMLRYTIYIYYIIVSRLFYCFGFTLSPAPLSFRRDVGIKTKSTATQQTIVRVRNELRNIIRDGGKNRFYTIINCSTAEKQTKYSNARIKLIRVCNFSSSSLFSTRFFLRIIYVTLI